jgi:phage terminase large subunit-like protein
MRQMVREAEHRPADREMFRQLHLNIWLDGAANPEWSLDVWDENSGELDLDALGGRSAWIGVDLSSRIDLTAVATAIPLDDGRIALHVQTFTPETGIRKKMDVDGAPYSLWAEQGYLTPCPGDTVDFAMVEAHIRKMAELFRVEEIAFDKWRAQDMMASLEGEGLPVAEFPQTVATFARPVVDFETAMFERRLVHGGNPLLRWAVSNVVMYRDSSDNRKPVKKQSADRIDPAVASIIAVGRAVANASGRSSYDDAPDDMELYLA